MTHSHVCHDSFTCVPWLIHMALHTHTFIYIYIFVYMWFVLCMYMYMNMYMYTKVWVMWFVLCMHMYTNMYMYMKEWVWSDVICSLWRYHLLLFICYIYAVLYPYCLFVLIPFSTCVLFSWYNMLFPFRIVLLSEYDMFVFWYTMSHGTHVNESWHTCEGVMAHSSLNTICSSFDIHRM